MKRKMDFLMASGLVLMSLMAQGWCQEPRPNYGRDDDQDDLVVGGIFDDVMNGLNEPDIPQTLLNMGLTTFHERLESQQLMDALSGTGPLTVFGPTNEAFSKLTGWTARRLLNSTALTRTLRYHVIPNLVLTAADLSDDMLFDTLLGKSIRINVFHKRRAPRVYTAQCVPIVDSMTSRNGIIHTTNKVLKPPYGDMLTSLEACPVFRNLTGAMRMVGLDNLIAGPFTMFAPTDYVFQKTYPDGMDILFGNSTALREMVLSHVVPGTYCTAGLEGERLRTLSGKILNPVFNGEDITINGVKLISRDGMVSDGVAHCVESLLWP